MITRWLPSPALSLALFAVWLLLNQSLEPATLLLAALLAIAVPLLTQALRPARAKIRKPMLVLRLCGLVAHDVFVSAFTVARLLLTRRSRGLAPRFVRVPLAIRDPNALATLAMILCLTPGTAWGEIALDRSTLLIHVFHEDDEAAFIDMIKTRYERALMEIFES
jgi:multicomponent K+:H+ antiporter subunit E